MVEPLKPPLPLAPRLVELKRGEVLFRMGEVPSWIYWVVSGELHAVRTTRGTKWCGILPGGAV